MRFAAVQLNSQDEIAPNLARVRELVAAAAARGATAVLLPENFAYLGKEEGKRAVAESLDGDGPIMAALRELATRHRMHLLAGGMPERSGDPLRPFNSCVVIAPDGTIAASYRKIHLFDVEVGDGVDYRESAATSAGTEPVVAAVGGWKVGLSVCYDLRFPELYRALTDRGAEVLIVPAAFTLVTGKDHWHVLLRARAIEAQAYVVAAAQWGRHGARATYGKTCIVDPWGEIVAQVSEGEGVVVADLDRAYLDQVRKRLPALRHRRFERET
jgi:deaminated glutathione amidase